MAGRFGSMLQGSERHALAICKMMYDAAQTLGHLSWKDAVTGWRGSGRISLRAADDAGDDSRGMAMEMKSVIRRGSMILCGLLWVATAKPAGAACNCLCVNGRMQAVCERVTEIQPVCPLRLCPSRRAEMAPLGPLVVPPLGTSKCRQAWVCDSQRRCSWQPLCR